MRVLIDNINIDQSCGIAANEDYKDIGGFKSVPSLFKVNLEEWINNNRELKPYPYKNKKAAYQQSLIFINEMNSILTASLLSISDKVNSTSSNFDF